MKYLDEQIEVQATASSSVAAGIYRYTVSRKNDPAPDSYTTIFAGSMFHNQGTTFKVNITDIVRNDIWVPNEDELYKNEVTPTAYSNNLVNSYMVEFYLSLSSVISSSDIQVAKVYRYPHYISDMSNECFFDYTQNNIFSVPLQGQYTESSIKKYHLTPKYPYINTDNYNFILASERSLNNTLIDVQGILVGGLIKSFLVRPARPSSFISYKLSNLFNNASRTVSYSVVYNSTYEVVGDFSLSYNNTTHIIAAYANQQARYCLFRLILLNNSNQYIRALSDWQEADQTISGSFTIDETFLEQNALNKVAIIFSEVTSSSTDLDDYDWGLLGFNISGHESELLGKTVAISGTFAEVAQQEWNVTNLRIVQTLDTSKPTYLTIGGCQVAEIEMNCPSRYYLQWQDRMGGFQSQPFNEHYTYSEKFDTQNIIDYIGRKRVSSISVTPTFKIRTDWIKEDLYPYYESIFTSPVLFLYDTKEDKRYSVLVTDSEYTEKTYDNQKKLINLILNLELNKTQNIIY